MEDDKPASKEEGGGAPGWVMTFADLMSLLMCFFVLLLSFSEMDVQKFKQIAGSMQMAFGVQRDVRAHEIPKGTSVVAKEFSPAKPQPTVLNEVRQVTSRDEQKILENKESAKVATESDARDIAKKLEKEIADGKVEVETSGRKIVIRILEKGSFPSGAAELDETFNPVIEKIQKAVMQVKGAIKITGHTDDRAISTSQFRSNWDLSAARALTVAHVLMASEKIDPKRFEIIGHADTRPVVSNDTDENREKNRRVDIIIMQDNDSIKSIAPKLPSPEQKAEPSVDVKDKIETTDAKDKPKLAGESTKDSEAKEKKPVTTTSEES